MTAKNIFSGKINSGAAVILLVCMTLLVYANSLKSSFVWDDFSLIVDNGFVKSWNNFLRIFNQNYLTKPSDMDNLREPQRGVDFGSGEFSYRPVGTISFFIDFSIWKLNPFGYHLTNLILHILNVMLLFIFINLITKNKILSLLTSLLFALHPVNAEVVNVISFRKDLLVLLFFISGFILYIKSMAVSSGKAVYFYILSLIMFLLALFSKEMAIIFPIALLCYDYFFKKPSKEKSTFVHFRNYYLGYTGILLFYIFVRFILINNPDSLVAKYTISNFCTSIFTMSKIFATYFQWLLLPINVHPCLPGDNYFASHSIFDPRVIISIVLIVFVFITAVKIRKKFPIASFGILWFFITIIPVSNIIPTLYGYIAARYLYVPMVGFCLAIAFFLVRLPDSRFFKINPSILYKISVNTTILLLIFYSIFTNISNIIFKNNTVFWMEMAEIYPFQIPPHFSLGTCFLTDGMIDKAIVEFKTLVSLDPNNAIAHNSLGVCYRRKGMVKDATDEFEQASKLDPSYTAAYFNLGNIFTEEGLYQKAIKYFEKTIQLDQKNLKAYNDLNVIYMQRKEYKEAKKLWEKVLQSGLANEEARANLQKLKQLGI